MPFRTMLGDDDRALDAARLADRQDIIAARFAFDVAVDVAVDVTTAGEFDVAVDARLRRRSAYRCAFCYSVLFEHHITLGRTLAVGLGLDRHALRFPHEGLAEAVRRILAAVDLDADAGRLEPCGNVIGSAYSSKYLNEYARLTRWLGEACAKLSFTGLPCCNPSMVITVLPFTSLSGLPVCIKTNFSWNCPAAAAARFASAAL
jgi:hypothetical protein